MSKIHLIIDSKYKKTISIAIERKKYMNLLNIPGIFLNYMVSGELGKGVILTQSSKYSFDDNLGLEEDCDGSDFYDLFKDDKENSLCLL